MAQGPAQGGRREDLSFDRAAANNSEIGAAPELVDTLAMNSSIGLRRCLCPVSYLLNAAMP